jgi:Na+/melibiose symporter-like transporter
MNLIKIIKFTVKLVSFIICIFALNFFLDALNAANWGLFFTGLIGSIFSISLCIWILFGTFTKLLKKKDEKLK